MSEPAPSKRAVAKATVDNIDKMVPQFAEVLPSDMKVDVFTRVVKMALQQNPELMEVDDRTSLFNACVRAAQQGLMPDGREGALVVFPARDKATGSWIKKVQWMPMVYGIMKSAARGGVTMRAVCVYQKDIDDERIRFWIDENGEHVTHQQSPFDDAKTKGGMVGVYALAISRDGRTFVEAMGLDQIAKVRASSRSKDSGPWKDWPEEMAKKSALHRLGKRLPPELFQSIEGAVRSVEDDYDFDQTADVPVAPVPAALPTKRGKGLQAVVDAVPPSQTVVEPEPEEPVPQAEDGDPSPDQEEFF